jgi:cytochrome c oxidase assembly factor CtaG
VLGSVQAQTDLLARRQHQRNQAKERKVERRIKWIAGAIGAVLTVGTITATVGEKAVSDLLERWEITPDAYGIMGPVIAETLAQLLLGVGITLLLAAVALVVATPVFAFTWLVRRAWRWPERRQPPGDD